MNASDLSQNKNLAQKILMAAETAVLLRLSPQKYTFYGLAPYFYTQLFPQMEDGSYCAAPWLHSPMMEFFLGEAEEFFAKAESGTSISSGMWLEELEGGEEVPLLATARALPDAQVILIQAVREEYAERARILRKARVDLLERRKLPAPVATFKKKPSFDPLTKLYTRESFLDLLQNQIVNLRTFAPNLALLMLDIDNFQQLNNDLGTAACDTVLIKAGDLLLQSLRKNDSVARYDGGKFAVLAPNTSFSQSLAVAEKLRRLVAEHDFGTCPITVSIGCTIYRPGEDARDLISRAESALHEARHSGPGTVRQRDPWSGGHLASDGRP